MVDESNLRNDKLLAAALRRRELLALRECFDPVDPESRPTPEQKRVIDDFGIIKTQWIVAANQSGKSQTCSRLLSWFITETHPTWTRPPEWGSEPLFALVACRTGKQIEDSIWPKVKSFLEPGTYKEVRIGNILNRVEFPNGARIVFQSLENPGQAAERIQSYVAHFVWIDEMPPTLKVLTEAMVRRNTRDGYFLASFTPLVVNRDIQKMVDNASEPASRKYRFRMFDNPAYSSPKRQREILDSMSTLPEHIRNTRLYGEWTQSDDQVYYFDYDSMVNMPVNYSPLWRHVEVVDPATSSALGLTVWAEDSASKIWYCIIADYIKGIHVPTLIVEAVRDRVRNLNIIKRISDPEATWYINQASAMGISYGIVYKANGRKSDLIKGLQEKLSSRMRIAPHCVDLIAELQEARWSNQVEGKIVNSSRFHLSDTAQYFADNIPKPEAVVEYSNQQEYLYQANEKRKQHLEIIRLRTQKQAIRRGRQSTVQRGFQWNSR